MKISMNLNYLRKSYCNHKHVMTGKKITMRKPCKPIFEIVQLNIGKYVENGRKKIKQ